MVLRSGSARAMRGAAKKLQGGYGARGLAAKPTTPLSITAEAAAGAAPLTTAFMREYDLPDPRSNATKLREMFYSDEMEFLMEAHVSAAHCIRRRPHCPAAGTAVR